MSEVLGKLKSILGEEFFNEITCGDAVDGQNSPTELTNSKEIYCECKTLILRPNHARLILPSHSMEEVEKHLKFLQNSEKSFKNLARGCYWLVDDMYKFEQIGYTKEVNSENQQTSQNREATAEQDNSQSSQTVQESDNQHQQSKSPAPNGLRYLVCAECNLCPLGWFDSSTKESYLYVW